MKWLWSSPVVCLVCAVVPKVVRAYKFAGNSGGATSLQDPKAVPLYAELAAAIPLVVINLTNYSGLITDRGAPPNPNITYHFGFLASDLEVLSDKVSGFYTVLHEMLGDDGPKLCPPEKQSHIKECLGMAMCLLQEHVPEDIELAQYTTYEEVVQRFVDIAWPVLKKGLLFEETTPSLHEDDVAPGKYQCDELQHPPPHVAEAGLNLLGTAATAAEAAAETEAAKTASALAVSAALSQAARTTHEVLDAHDASASVDATVQKLHRVWHPVCKELRCDHTNFWDFHFASHGQTMALTQLAVSARHVRTEVRQRLRLEQRVFRFVEDNHGYFGTIRNSSSPGRKFVDPAFIQASSRQAFQRYANRGRESMIRALRLLDQVEFRKFQERKVQRAQPDQLAQSNEEEELSVSSDEREDQDDPMYLQVSSDDDISSGSEDGSATAGWRRRRRRSRRRRRRRWIGGRRRRRRRRRVFEAVVAAVAKDVGEFMANGLACIGTAAEFTSTGYSYEVVPGAVSMNLGLSSGSGQSLDKLVKGHPPVAFISVDFGFAVGITAKLTWSGVGLGGGVGCSRSGCSAYITVAAVASVNLPMVTAACPFGPTLGAATCAQAFGGGISTMCCNMNLQTGSNDCR